MARLKMVYIGGGSTRAAGTMASFIDQGENFDGSEIVLVDLNEERLSLVKRLAEQMVQANGLDLRIEATTDRRAALAGCDAVLSSYRPGGFEARYLDEAIPLKYGIIGQETQGPGGFFMALRSIHVMQGIIRDMEEICPNAKLFNYTNPINIVSEAVTHHSDLFIVSLCEGPIIFPQILARAAGLDPDKVEATMIGVNHNCWSVNESYDGQPMIPLLQEAYQRKLAEGSTDQYALRLLRLASMMDSIPSAYFQYYYYHDEIVEELRQKGTTRAQDIMAQVSSYWEHYEQQASEERPVLNPKRSRGGIHELELAIDAMDAIFNNRKEVLPVNVTNNGAIPDFPDDLVVEVPAYIDQTGIHPLVQPHMSRQVVGLVKMLAEYQALTAEAAWSGSRKTAIQALASHPFVHSLDKAERIYDEMAAAHRDYLPERLLK